MARAPDLTGCALEDRYELHALIGEGAFGRVYRGVDRRLERAVAVKVIKPWWAEDPDWAVSFEREAQLLARASAPGIVQIYDIGHAPEGLYYVSELVQGESLARRLTRGALEPWDACEIAEQLCLALARAHAERIVHRDVKPANILIADSGQVKIGDFGVARIAEGTSDGVIATVVGTPRYMAPEQSMGHATTPATDVYSVGVVLHEMIAGQPPFSGDSAVELALRHLQDDPPDLPAGTPRELAAVLARAMAKKPRHRYADGRAMAAALADARQAREHETVRIGVAVGAGAAGNGNAATADGVTANGDTLPFAAADFAQAWDLQPSEPRTRIDEPPPAPERTQSAPRYAPRKNIDPPGRRRRRALLGLVALLIAGLAAAAAMIGTDNRAHVPDLSGATKHDVTVALKLAGLRGRYATRYDSAHKRGTEISQRPRSGTALKRGTIVHVVISAGPKPVSVPRVDGETVDAGQAELARLHLHSNVVLVAAPGVRPGTITHQSPGVGQKVRPGATVVLSVSEAPRWRPLTSFTGTGAGHSVAFQIRGGRWRIGYSMVYKASCTLFVFCSGPPQGRIVNPHTGAVIGSFDVSNGDGTENVSNGPGLYEVTISPGSDSARYDVRIEDYY